MLSGCTNTDLGACDAVVVMVVVEVVVVVMVVVECVSEEMLFCVLCLVGGWIWI